MSRRDRQRIANREAILQAALTIAQKEGWLAVTIRRIATEIDYTSPIIYQHFVNKEAALQALMVQGHDELQRVLEQTVQEADPEHLPLELGAAYLTFAQQHPKLYELMNGLAGVVLDGRVRHAASTGVTEVTTRALMLWAKHRGVSLSDPQMACETAWGVVHGMVSLGMLEDIGFGRARKLAAEALEALMQRWEEPMI